MEDYFPPAESTYLPLIDAALAEDIGTGDITTRAFITPFKTATYHIVPRESGIICGVDVVKACFERYASFKNYEPYPEQKPDVDLFKEDGQGVKKGDAVIRISGNIRDIMAVERTALNLLSYLSGIATQTRSYVNTLENTGAQLLDTRKTLPGYRELAKYAVRCGGARNHRMRLDDGVMIKDNHIEVAGNIADAVMLARRSAPALTKIEVECETLEQVEQALQAGAEMIMLDNMELDEMRQAVKLVGGRVPLEASGNVTLERLEEIAATGVNFISSGALTHSVKALDFGMDFVS